jgi:hypothetical protein
MNLQNLIEVASFEPYRITPPNSWCGHLPFSAWLIQVLAPKMLVELGTYSGNSYLSFCQSIAHYGLDCKCFAVDTWEGDEHTGQYGQEIFNRLYVHNEQYYSNFSRLLRMTFDEALEYFSDGSIELLHIDGLHTYEAVRHDFETWLPKLAPGAVVILHDINVRERGFGVWRLWEELKAQYPAHLEFSHSHGLGILQMDNGSLSKTIDWLSSGAQEKFFLQRFFSSVGARQQLRCDLIECQQSISAVTEAVAQRDIEIAELKAELTKLMKSARFLVKQLFKVIIIRLFAYKSNIG